MRQRLADSIEYIRHRVERRFDHPDDELTGALKRIRGGRVSPMLFATYCDLVLALNAGDETLARARLGALASASPTPPGIKVVEFGKGEELEWLLVGRLLDTDKSAPLNLQPPRKGAARRCKDRIGRALTLLDRARPRLAGEIRALLQMIIVARADVTVTGADFGGASSFMLWGAIALNEQAVDTDLDMVVSLVHESGHNYLFGMSADAPLVISEGDEKFSSPLRSDPRPLDGIFHATYVVARMHYALVGLLRLDSLAERDRHQAMEQIDILEQHFATGISTIERHATLSALGAAVLDSARRHMARHARSRRLP